MANPTFVQGAVNSDGAGTGVTALGQAFGSNNVQGNTSVVIVTSFDTRANVVAADLTDTNSNKYKFIASQTGVGGSIYAWVANNIKAGANTVNMAWGTGGADFPDLWIVEATASLFDAVGLGQAATGGEGGADGLMAATVIPTLAGDLIVETGIVGSHITAAGTGFTQRVPGTGVDANGAFLATKAAAAVGSQVVNMTQNTSSSWGIIAIALKAMPYNPLMFNTNQ